MEFFVCSRAAPHVAELGLPGVAAAREFVAHEPYNRAGAYADHLLRRFHNRLDRTMWEFPRSSREPRFVVIAHGSAGPRAELPRERLIVHGGLLTPDDARPAGAVWALEAPARDAVGSLFDPDVEILDWEFGGRR